MDAWNSASMGSYMINSVIVTALSLALLLVIALPAAYCLWKLKRMMVMMDGWAMGKMIRTMVEPYPAPSI